MTDAQTPRPNVEQIITFLEDYLASMRADPERHQLDGLDADTAFELGYETAIFDLRHQNDLGMEIDLVTVDIPAQQEEQDVEG